jgi:UDPglucose 6-dehydrogenase
VKISVIGLGKLGLCTAACFAKKHDVIGIDTNKLTVQKINSGWKPIREDGLELNNLRASTSYRDVKKTEITFIVVPTPLENGEFTNKYLFSVIKRLNVPKEHTVVIVSTVMPGTTYEVQRMLNCDVVYNPEFIALGSVIKDFLNPDFILIGGNAQKLIPIYKSVCENNPPFAMMSPLNAEITKLALNCYVTMKISFANSLSQICDKVGANAQHILQAIGNDSRIGHKYLSPGLGFGGPCFPRDNIAFSTFAKKTGSRLLLSEATQEINKEQVNRVVNHVKSLKKEGIIGILGLSYKPGTHITEESQALEIAKILSKDYKVIAYDPRAKSEFDVDTPEKCIKQADIVLILTPWEEFKSLRIDKPLIDCWGIT